MNHALHMIAYVQCLMMAATSADAQSSLYARLVRIEAYLIDRCNRE